MKRETSLPIMVSYSRLIHFSIIFFCGIFKLHKTAEQSQHDSGNRYQSEVLANEMRKDTCAFGDEGGVRA